MTQKSIVFIALLLFVQFVFSQEESTETSSRAARCAKSPDFALFSFKKATESHSRNKNYQFWQYGNHAEEIYSEKFMCSKLDYIHLNPIRAGIVERGSDYMYSSATNYVGEESILKTVVLVANPVVDVLKASSFIKYNQY